MRLRRSAEGIPLEQKHYCNTLQLSSLSDRQEFLTPFIPACGRQGHQSKRTHNSGKKREFLPFCVII